MKDNIPGPMDLIWCMIKIWDSQLGDGFYFTVSRPGMKGDELLFEMLRHGMAGIPLKYHRIHKGRCTHLCFPYSGNPV